MEVTLIMEQLCDRPAEAKAAAGRLEIGRGDLCDAFEQDADRLFSARECWYCKYGDFGILTEHPTQKGVCRHQKKIVVQANEKREEKRL